MEDDEQFEWDQVKAAENLRKHGVRLELGVGVFNDPHHLLSLDAFAVSEDRFLAIGHVDGRLLTVVFSEPAEGLIRLISVRKATPAERRRYDGST